MSNVSNSSGSRQYGIIVARTRLFFASYAPLLFVFAVLQDSDKVSYALAGVGLIGLLVGWTLLIPGKRNPRTITVHDVRDKGSEVSGYLATYLLPFVSAPPDNSKELSAYVLYGLVAYLVFIRSSLGLVNPSLSLLGYSVVEARVNASTVLVICKRVPMDGQQISVYGIMGGNGYLVS